MYSDLPTLYFVILDIYVDLKQSVNCNPSFGASGSALLAELIMPGMRDPAMIYWTTSN